VAVDREVPVQFAPMERASRARLLVVVVLGPVLWLAGLLVVGLVVQERRAVEIGLIAALVSFVVSLLVCVVGWRLRLAEERNAART
jgi:hypothetical protein